MDKESPDLSGVYMPMRSLVKKMSSPKVRNLETANGFCQGGNLVNGSQGSSEVVNPQIQQPSPLPQMKKKVRRRLHTRRPYQERLLNMAEARREIVTALKFHRASMKQQQQEQPLQILSHASSPDLEPIAAEMNSSKSPVINPSDGGLYHSPSLTYDPSSNHMLYPNAHFPSDSSCDLSSFSFSLPSQTLGLNLNFQDLSNLGTSPFQHNPSSFTSPSSSSSSPALSSTTTATDEIHYAAEDSRNGAFLISQPEPENMGGCGILSPYPAMDSEVMKEMKSMEDCYDMVWNDTMNSMTSACWFEFSKATENRPDEDNIHTQLTEHPSWLNPADCYLQPNLNIACPRDSSPDPTLPCLDIGEIEGVDGDWLA